jgi:Ca2+-transporting ATPase
LPIHILWINLVTDGLPGLALGSEQPERDIMNRPPRKSDESLFSGGIGAHIIWVGILMAAITIATEAWSVDRELPHWQTMVFTVLSFSQLIHVMAIRSERQSLFRIGVFSNRPLVWALAVTVALQLAVIYVPFANGIFKTQPLTVAEMGMCIGVSMVVLIAVEIEKLFRKRVTQRIRKGAE